MFKSFEPHHVMSPLPSRTQLSKGKGVSSLSLFDKETVMCYAIESSDRDGQKFNWKSHRDEIASLSYAKGYNNRSPDNKTE